MNKLLRNSNVKVFQTYISKHFKVSPGIQRTLTTESKFQIKDEFEGRPLYLDAQATTPLDPRVLDEMMPYLTSYYGNPHSRTHAYGWESEAAVEKARIQVFLHILSIDNGYSQITYLLQVANLIGADSKEIIFTSGATESNNIAVKGVARFYASKKKHIITTQTEHKCVLDSCRALEAEGFRVTYLPVQENGNYYYIKKFKYYCLEHLIINYFCSKYFKDNLIP